MMMSYFQNKNIIKVNYLTDNVALSSLTLLFCSCTGLSDTVEAKFKPVRFLRSFTFVVFNRCKWDP